MRSSSRLLKYVPLIKFVGGPHVAPKNVSHAPKPHPFAPNGILPGQGSSSGSTYFNSNPIQPKEGEYFSRAELSARFRYKAPKVQEIGQIDAGGAELIF